MANDTPSNHVSRRALLRNAAAATVAGTALAQSQIYAEQPSQPKGRIKQSIVHWCFGGRGEKWDAALGAPIYCGIHIGGRRGDGRP